MNTLEILRSGVALGAGALIGALFASLQSFAHRRYERLQAKGELNNGWRVMLGSPRRVFWFLLGLIGLQILFPSLFQNGAQWWVSGGVALGYGLILLFELSRRRAQNA